MDKVVIFKRITLKICANHLGPRPDVQLSLGYFHCMHYHHPLLSIYDELHELVSQGDYEHTNNNDEFVELILHFKKIFEKEDASKDDEKFLDLCKVTGNLCELWYGKNYDDMRLICDTFINAKFGIKTSDVLSMETAKLTIDPNRQSLKTN